ncbi:flippase [Marinobacter sp.]|uniref:flippase n=1 Tax=Marinobacter sp. TaxID=50741 RepID=UPI003BAD2955
MKNLIETLKHRALASPLRRNIGMTLGRQILAAFAQLLIVVLIARQVGPEGNGFYAMAILLPTLMVNFLNLGVGPATVYYVSRREFTLPQVLVGNLKLGYVVSAVGVLVALPMIGLWGERLFPGVPSQLLYLGLLSFPLILLAAYLNTILQGLESFGAFNLTVLVPPYVNLTGVVIALYVLGFGVAGAMVAYIVGQLVGLALVLTLLRRTNTETEQLEIPTLREYSRKTLTYGWKAHLSNILAFVNYRADIFLVNLLLTPVATGIYVIAVQIAEKLWMLSQAASIVLLPRLAAMHQSPRDRLALTNKGFWVVAGLTAAAGIVGAIALYWLIAPIFGKQYQEVWAAFVWLLPGIIAGAGARLQSNCIAAAGKPEWNMYVSVGVVSINLGGNLLLIPEHGIIGAAWATSIAYGFNAVVKFWLIRKTLNINPTR